MLLSMVGVREDPWLCYIFPGRPDLSEEITESLAPTATQVSRTCEDSNNLAWGKKFRTAHRTMQYRATCLFRYVTKRAYILCLLNIIYLEFRLRRGEPEKYQIT